MYEGTIVSERAVLAPGTILTGGTAVFDLVHDRVYRREGDRPLEIPAGAVVVPGTRPVRSGPGREAGIALYTPVIVKYRDEKTETVRPARGVTALKRSSFVPPDDASASLSIASVDSQVGRVGSPEPFSLVITPHILRAV